MALQASGQITYEDIAAELNDSSTQMSMDSFTAQAIGSTAITNTPDEIEDWYSYSHTTTPNAPTGFTAVENGDGLNIDLNWTDNSSGTGQEDHFRIEVNYNSGGYTFLVNTAQDATSYQHATLNCPTDTGDTYQYRIRAENAAGDSSYATSSVVNVACA